MVEGLSRFSIEKLSIDRLMTKKNEKLISKVYKKILRQIEKEPMKNWFEININDYSPKEMRIIKRFFCDWCGFGFSKYIPCDKMYIENVSIGTSVIESIVSGNYNVKSNIPIEKFYITWFDEN